LLPRHPLGRQQRRRSGDQHHFTDRGVVGTGIGGDDDGPLPALVARQMRQEPVRGSGWILEPGAEVVPHRVGAAELRDGGPGRVAPNSGHRTRNGSANQHPGMANYPADDADRRSRRPPPPPSANRYLPPLGEERRSEPKSGGPPPRGPTSNERITV